jgi:spermidine/putrescine ABC transporter ATP-binding subunit
LLAFKAYGCVIVVSHVASSSVADVAPVNGEVEVRGIAKRFGAVDAVRSTTFRVASGTFVTLLGPSGSGKTTLLKLIAGFEEPSAGTVHIAGREVTHVAPYRRNVGFVFQQYALFPHLTVAQNVAYPLEMRRSARSDICSAVSETLDLVRLGDLAGRRPSELSGGQQQRVALARAIVFRPPVLLMDEPMAALDKRLREEMQYEIRALQRRLGITTISVTHDQSEALVMSDKIFVLKDGMLQQSGSPEDLYHSPCNEFVATFLGESNILQGQIAGPADGPSLMLSESLRIPLTKPAPQVGTQSAYVLRPEAIDVAPMQGASGVTVHAQVIDRVFCGDVVRLRLQLRDAPDTTLIAKIVAARSREIPEIGSIVRANWRSEDMIIVKRQ